MDPINPAHTHQLQRNLLGFARLCLVRSGRYHPENPILENRLVKINQESDRNIQQLHVAKQLRFVDRGCKTSVAFSSTNKQSSTRMSKRRGSSKMRPLYSTRTIFCVVAGIERSSNSRSKHRS
jgi:hypothetical protein